MTGEALLFLVGAFPLGYFLVLGVRERFRGGNALLVLFGLGLIVLPSALRVLDLSVVGLARWAGMAGPLEREMADAILGGILGPLAVLMGLLREVRYRRLAEDELRRRAGFRDAVLGAFPHAVFVVDREGRVEFTNETARKLFGASPEQRMAELVGPIRSRSAPRVASDLALLQRDFPAQLRSMGDRLLSVSKQPLAGQAGTPSSVHWVEDLTALAGFANMTREFVTTLSHDLRTPLTSVRGYVELLLEGELGEMPPQQRQALVVVEQHTQMLERMVNDYLDLSRLEAGILPLQEEPFDLWVALEEATSVVDPAFEAKGVSLRVDRSSAPLLVRGDQQRVVQVLSNLLSNAQKYAPRGGDVEVTAAAGGEWTQVNVKDTGPGIPEAEQPYVFSKFYRATFAAQSQEPGSGLGLAIAKSIVEMHGGRLWLESQPGQGSTFRFTLPRAGL